MISFLHGKVCEIGDNFIVLDCGHIGYQLTATSSTLLSIKVGEEVTLNTYMHVREDEISLFGFNKKDEKNMFLKLISVSGIGCKVAINILSSISTEQLAISIYNGDIRTLSRIKGLGKKTAERLVLELREKVNAGLLTEQESIVPSVNSDAVALLVSLGLSSDDATNRVESASKLGANTTEELINMALRMG